MRHVVEERTTGKEVEENDTNRLGGLAVAGQWQRRKPM
jgi:hypothetical protein